MYSTSNVCKQWKQKLSDCLRIEWTSAWIGLTRDEHSTSGSDLAGHREGWKWEDGSPYDHKVYHKWDPHEPEAAAKDCVALWNGMWFARDCNNAFHCLCEKVGKCI